MANSPRFQNVAARMLSGHNAYDANALVCLAYDETGGCVADMAAVVKGACSLNFLTMW